MAQIPIATGFYEDAARPISRQECTNWIPQVPQTNAQTEAQLIHTPGITEFADTGQDAARGEHEVAGTAFTVNGNDLFRINEDGTTDNLGVISGAGAVSIADNGVQMCIVVPGGLAYIYTATGGLVTITDTDFTLTLGPSQQVVYIDGYFVHYNNDAPASSQPIFFNSALNDGTSYDALDFGTAEIDPDIITGLHVNKNRLYVGGRVTLEPFTNVGGVGFPFQRIAGAVVQKGVAAKFTMKDFDNSFVFVGAGESELPAVWRFEGGGASRISNNSIDNIIQQLTAGELEAIFGTVYSENGAFIYYVHLNDRTFGYDAATGVWHERKSKDSFGQLVNWRVRGIFEAYGKILVTDNQSGSVGVMDTRTYTEYGTSVQRIVSTGPILVEDSVIGEMELTCEAGTATSTGDGSDPFVSRQISDDGAYTYGNSTARSLGLTGEYKKRQIWRREGQAYVTRVVRFTIDEPIKTSIIKLEIR